MLTLTDKYIRADLALDLSFALLIADCLKVTNTNNKLKIR